MAFVVGVLQPADGGRGGSHQPGELALGKPSLKPQVENLPGHIISRAHLIQRREPVRATGVVPPVQAAEAILCLLILCAVTD